MPGRQQCGNGLVAIAAMHGYGGVVAEQASQALLVLMVKFTAGQAVIGAQQAGGKDGRAGIE